MTTLILATVALAFSSLAFANPRSVLNHAQFHDCEVVGNLRANAFSFILAYETQEIHYRAEIAQAITRKLRARLPLLLNTLPDLSEVRLIWISRTDQEAIYIAVYIYSLFDHTRAFETSSEHLDVRWALQQMLETHEISSYAVNPNIHTLLKISPLSCRP